MALLLSSYPFKAKTQALSTWTEGNPEWLIRTPSPPSPTKKKKKEKSPLSEVLNVAVLQSLKDYWCRLYSVCQKAARGKINFQGYVIQMLEDVLAAVPVVPFLLAVLKYLHKLCTFLVPPPFFSYPFRSLFASLTSTPSNKLRRAWAAVYTGFISAKRVCASICGYAARIPYGCIFHALLDYSFVFISVCGHKSSSEILRIPFEIFAGTPPAIRRVYRADERRASQLAQLPIMCPSQFTSWLSCSETYAEINKIAPLLFIFFFFPSGEMYKIHIHCWRTLIIAFNRNTRVSVQHELM